jgi:hypothetical protein
MVASYLLSKKYYPIKYNLRKTGLYFIVAMLFFGLSEWLNLEPGIIKYLFHNVLIVVFVGLVWFFERNTVRDL